MRRFRFVGNPSEYEWDEKPIVGKIYNGDHRGHNDKDMFTSSPIQDWKEYSSDWEEVFDEPIKPEKPIHKDTDLGYFAGVAMQALICNPNIKRPDDSIEENEAFSKVAIMYAKSLIEALDKEVGNG